MAYSYNNVTHVIVDLPTVPGSSRPGHDTDDRGGGNLPQMRAGRAARKELETIIAPAASTLGLKLADALELAASLDNWTINGIGPAPVTVEVSGDAVQIARITIG